MSVYTDRPVDCLYQHSVTISHHGEYNRRQRRLSTLSVAARRQMRLLPELGGGDEGSESSGMFSFLLSRLPAE